MSSLECEWCEGEGCDECEPGSQPLGMSDHANTSSTVMDCEWCEGVGCDECQPALVVHHSPATTVSIQPPSLTHSRSMILPSAFKSTVPVSVSEEDVLSFVQKQISSVSNQLWVSFDDAEVMLRNFNWNQSELEQRWMDDSDAVKTRCAIPLNHHSSPDTTTPPFFDPNQIFSASPTRTCSSNSTPTTDTVADIDTDFDDADNNNTSMHDISRLGAPPADPQSHTDDDDSFECNICFGDYTRDEVTFLTCGHFTCTNCLHQHIVETVHETQIQSIHVRCPALALKDATKAHTNDNNDKCEFLIPYSISFTALRLYEQNAPVDPTVTAYTPFAPPELPWPISPHDKKAPTVAANDTTYVLMSPTHPTHSSVYNTPSLRFRRWFIDYFVDAQRPVSGSRGSFRHCTSSHACPLFLFVPANPSFDLRSPPFSSHRYTLTNPFNHGHICPCGALQCASCGLNGGHFPASCELAAKYNEVTDPDHLSNEMIRATSKHCPKCNTLITKDRNCNHVTCTKCRFDFCYLCKSSWSQHTGVFSCKAMADSKLSATAASEYNQSLESHMNIKNIMLFHRRAEAYQSMGKKFLTLFASVFGSPLSQLPAHAAHRAKFEEFPSIQLALQIYWFTCSLVYWTFATLSFLPRDASTRVIRSQQALCLGAFASATKQANQIMSNIETSFDSATIQVFRDSFSFLQDYTERTSKAFVVDSENRKELALKESQQKAIVQAQRAAAGLPDENTSSQSTSAAHSDAEDSDEDGDGNDPPTSDTSQTHSEDDDAVSTPSASGADSDSNTNQPIAGANTDTQETSTPKRSKRPKKKQQQADAIPSELEWSCTACGCIHLPETSDLLFDDLSNGSALLADITEIRTKAKAPNISSSTPLHKDGLCQFKGVATVPSTNHPSRGGPKHVKGEPTKLIIICANCSHCYEHGDIDCRVCFPR